jgi:hypothetical protein
LVEDDAGCLLLGWQDHPLFAVSSWNAVWFHSLHCLLDQNFRRPPPFFPPILRSLLHSVKTCTQTSFMASSKKTQ